MKKRPARHPRKQKTAVPKLTKEQVSVLTQAVENSSEMIGMCDADGRITFVNRAFLQAFGFSREESIGQHFGTGLAATNPPELVREIDEKATKDEGWKGEIVASRRDGTTFPFFLSVGPIKDEAGRVVGSLGIGQDITVRRQEEAALRDAHERLRAALLESEQRAKEGAKITELVDVLQSCQTVDEAYQITGKAVPAILSSPSGALCITSSSRNVVEAVVTWGDEIPTERTFGPDSCWALRRGKVHCVKDPASPMHCRHVGASSASAYVCVPLAAQGETLGVLCLGRPRSTLDPSNISLDREMETLARQGSAVGERISLALANLRLREVLRGQSIRDPLTGLFNRRYMEESLERELRRAIRNGQPVSLIMLDIDHFKQFNDTFGHQAGDTLLRALGDFMSQRTRGQDVACRYGGEEFAVILAGASGLDAMKRAELLREEFRQLTVSHAGQVLGRVSLSMGISAFPDHGSAADLLLRAADGALYCAKAEGRDRINIAPPTAGGHQPHAPSAS
jgi:diguanylate cyclase (GGDEF)-like protein/PAS domain S-box-containing protein